MKKTVAHLFFGALVIIASGSAAENVAKAAAPAAGSANGTFTFGGKTVKLAYAAAFVDQESNLTYLLVTDNKVPAESWTSQLEIMRYLIDKKNPSQIDKNHVFTGVAFVLDKKREMLSADYYASGFPTSTGGVFELKLDAGAPKTFSGSAWTDPRVKEKNLPEMQATFSATLK
jgi:hypothetical protein